MLDYHALKAEVKKSLLIRWQQLDIVTDPLIWVWSAHTLIAEGKANNPLFGQVLEQSRRWLDSDNAWDGDSHLGSIGFLYSSLYQTDSSEQIKLKLTKRVQQLREKGIGKFSRLNDPDFVFGLAIGIGDQLPEELLAWLRNHCRRNAQPGNWRRGLLFAAAAWELGEKLPPFVINGTELQVHEVFPALWIAERYPELVEGEERRRGLWETFERIKESVNFEASMNDGDLLYPVSLIDVAMFYEALCHQTSQVDPATLFRNIPWHPEIRRSSENLFTKGEYVMAVFQAAVTFIDSVKKRSHHPTDTKGKPLDGVDLMVRAFGSKPPILKFNDLKEQADENEQRGLSLIAQGIVSAVRNPKGHTPQANIILGPYEALEQLAVISHLMKRLDSATA